MRYGSEHKAQTRTRVLEEAAAVIRTDGADRVGVAQVMSRAGLTHGGFYAHFASKDDLIVQAIAFMFEDGAATFFDRPEGGDPAVALSRYIDWYLSMAHRDRIDRACPIPILAGQASRLPAAARDRFAAAIERLTGAVAALLARMEHATPDATAAASIATMVGVVAMARLQRDDAKALILLETVRASVRTACGLPHRERLAT